MGVVPKRRRRRALRALFLDGHRVACCAVCNKVGPSQLFDVDHIIPHAKGGPDVPWNLWLLCLDHHRIKTLSERDLLKHVGREHFCWACGRVSSRFWPRHEWFCDVCAESTDRFQVMRERMKLQLHRMLQ